jgi:spore germination cell wall hydrolase CwlJ-like protein
VNLTAREKLLLALTVYGEARGESEQGRIAVAQVILNRASRPRWWGKSVEEVILKPYQFSCWNVGDPNAVLLRGAMNGINSITETNAFIACTAAVMEAQLLRFDLTNGADHYCTHKVRPSWFSQEKVTARIGGHVFFRLEA